LPVGITLKYDKQLDILNVQDWTDKLSGNVSKNPTYAAAPAREAEFSKL
jgi:hypothetical protein